MCNNQLTSTLYAVLFTTCLCQKPSLARILLVRVLTQTAREYNPVQSTFYDVNYIFDKKTTEDHSGSEGNFGCGTASAREEWGEEAIHINRFLNYRLMQLTQNFHLVLNMIWFFLLQITRMGASRISCSTGVVAFTKINVVLVVYCSWHY